MTATPIGWTVDLNVFGASPLSGRYSGVFVFDAATQTVPYWDIPIGPGFETSMCNIRSCFVQTATALGDTLDFNAFMQEGAVAFNLKLVFTAPLDQMVNVVQLVPGTASGTGSILRYPGGPQPVAGLQFLRNRVAGP